MEHTQNPLAIWIHCPKPDTEDVRANSFAIITATQGSSNFSVDTMVDQFIQLYSPDAPRWDNISSLVSSFEWADLVSQSTAEYFDTHGISLKFTREYVEAATRVNYGQNVDKIHALEGACSMVAMGASSIQGGNFQIFEHFLLRSKANLFSGVTVGIFSLQTALHD